MNTFKAQFFESELHTPIIVNVSATQRFVVLDFLNSDGTLTNTIYWEHELIKLNKIDNLDEVQLSNGASFIIINKDFLNLVKSKYRFAHYVAPGATLIWKNKWLILTSVLILFSLSVYFWLLPFIGNYLISLFPQKTEVELGEMFKKQLMNEEHFEIDSSKTKAINLFYKDLHLKGTYDIKISVVKSPVKNAFALPGGNIFVYTGLLNKINKPEQLVALLGHESGHVEHRHSLKSALKNTSFYLLIMVLTGQADNSMIMQLVNLKSLANSREAEEDADQYALNIIRNHQLDPQGMISLFNILKEEDQSFEVPAMLLTHPKLDERINVVKQEIHKGGFRIQKNKALEQSFNAIFK